MKKIFFAIISISIVLGILAYFVYKDPPLQNCSEVKKAYEAFSGQKSENTVALSKLTKGSKVIWEVPVGKELDFPNNPNYPINIGYEVAQKIIEKRERDLKKSKFQKAYETLFGESKSNKNLIPGIKHQPQATGTTLKFECLYDE